MMIRLIAVLALAFALLGCGSGDDDPADAVHTAAGGEVYNDADVAFATAMVPHLAETVQYVVLADERPLGKESRQLADRLRETRVLDVEQMITWLNDWDQPIPETVLDHVNAGHGDGHHASGSAAVDELRAASDEEFEALWRRALREQILDGIAIAETEQRDGLHEGAVALAASLVATQREQAAELATGDES